MANKNLWESARWKFWREPDGRLVLWNVENGNTHRVYINDRPERYISITDGQFVPAYVKDRVRAALCPVRNL